MYPLNFNGVVHFRVENFNVLPKHPKNINIDEEVRSYIIQKFREGNVFYLYLNNEVYRCASLKSDIYCINISDIINRVSDCDRNLKTEVRRREHSTAFMDLLIHNLKNYLFLMDGFLAVDDRELIKKTLDDMRNLLRKAYLFLLTSERLVKRRIRISAVIEDIFKALEEKAKEKRLKLKKSCGNMVVYGDIIIREALFNIIDNAIKYSPKGGVVSVKCFKEGRDVLIKISDEGKGIPSELRDLVFERFKRDEESVGMGLGLAIAKHIVDMHGGKIWVEENMPKGSAFCILLPKK